MLARQNKMSRGDLFLLIERVSLRPSNLTVGQRRSSSGLAIMLKLTPESRITSVERNPLGPLARRISEMLNGQVAGKIGTVVSCVVAADGLM